MYSYEVLTCLASATCSTFNQCCCFEFYILRLCGFVWTLRWRLKCHPNSAPCALHNIRHNVFALSEVQCRGAARLLCECYTDSFTMYMLPSSWIRIYLIVISPSLFSFVNHYMYIAVCSAWSRYDVTCVILPSSTSIGHCVFFLFAHCGKCKQTGIDHWYESEKLSLQRDYSALVLSTEVAVYQNWYLMGW